MGRAGSEKALTCDACGEPLHADDVGRGRWSLTARLLSLAAVAWFAGVLWPGGATAQWVEWTSAADEDLRAILHLILGLPGLVLLGVGLALPRVRDLACAACGRVQQVGVRSPVPRRGAERRQARRARRLRLSDESQKGSDWTDD